MKADITGKKLVTLKNKETACLGGAILAGVGVGAFPSVESVADKILVKKTYAPSGTDYTEAYENYQKADRILNV
jgi:xylulokinase